MKLQSVLVVLAFLAAISYAQNSSGTKAACMCLCCSTQGECGIPGAYQVDSCDQCSDSIAANCPVYFPDLCNSYASEEQCSPAEIGSDWTGDWVIDPCSACLLDEKNQPVGECLPCCDSTQCDCIYGTVTINNYGTSDSNSTSVQQLQMSVSGTTSATSLLIANQTGNTGITATVTITDKYDLIKDGDHIKFMNRRNPASCNVAATRNPPTTSILKLALLLGGVGVVVLACIVFCCCNPCAKKKQKDTALLGEGQTEGAPQEYSPVPDVGGINYTGKPNPSGL